MDWVNGGRWAENIDERLNEFLLLLLQLARYEQLSWHLHIPQHVNTDINKILKELLHILYKYLYTDRYEDIC